MVLLSRRVWLAVHICECRGMFFHRRDASMSGSGFIRKELLEYRRVAVLPFRGDPEGEVSWDDWFLMSDSKPHRSKDRCRVARTSNSHTRRPSSLFFCHVFSSQLSRFKFNNRDQEIKLKREFNSLQRLTLGLTRNH